MMMQLCITGNPSYQISEQRTVDRPYTYNRCMRMRAAGWTQD
jgi:hypothetical protein